MNIQYNFKNFDASDHVKEYAASRFGKLEKYVPESDESELQVNLSVDKHRQMAEVIFSADNVHISAYEESQDMYATIDLVLDKLEAQLRKMREKMKSRRRSMRDGARMDVISFSEEDGTRTQTIVESDQFVPKPMSVEESAMQLDSLNYEFLVFRNADTERINVIYRRKNNDFGLIDPGM